MAKTLRARVFTAARTIPSLCATNFTASVYKGNAAERGLLGVSGGVFVVGAGLLPSPLYPPALKKNWTVVSFNRNEMVLSRLT